jgi:hypothetical protein
MICILSLFFITNSFVKGGSKLTVASGRYGLSDQDSLMITLNLTQDNIIGVWTYCATTYRGVTMYSTIEFKRDKTAIIRYGSLQDTQLVNWVLANEMLQIDLMENTNGQRNMMLKDKVYEVHLKQDSLHYVLKLTAKNKDAIYYMGRDK